MQGGRSMANDFKTHFEKWNDQIRVTMYVLVIDMTYVNQGQCETVLHCDDASHWLGASLK